MGCGWGECTCQAQQGEALPGARQRSLMKNRWGTRPTARSCCAAVSRRCRVTSRSGWPEQPDTCGLGPGTQGTAAL